MNEGNHSTRGSIGIDDAEGVPNRSRGFGKNIDGRNQLRPRLDAVAGLERLTERGNPVERHMQRLRGIEQLFGCGICRENDVAGFPDRIRQRLVRFSAGPLFITDREAAQIRLGEQNVVDHQLRWRTSEKVEQRGVRQSRPWPPPDDARHPTDAVVVD